MKILGSKCRIGGGGDGEGGDGTFQCLFMKCGVKILWLMCRRHGENPETNYMWCGDTWAHV